MADMAYAVGYDSTASNYTAIGARLRKVFHSRFYNSSTSMYGANPLLAQSLTVAPLALGNTVPGAEMPHVLLALATNIGDQGNHMTVGSVGAKHLLPQLQKHGMGDLAMKIATETTFPSFGYWLSKGATTCWENYSGEPDASHPP